MDAETYLRNLAESELRRYRDGGPESMLEATGRMRAVAAAFAGTGALELAVADTVLNELTTALRIAEAGGVITSADLATIAPATHRERAPSIHGRR